MTARHGYISVKGAQTAVVYAHHPRHFNTVNPAKMRSLNSSGHTQPGYQQFYVKPSVVPSSSLPGTPASLPAPPTPSKTQSALNTLFTWKRKTKKARKCDVHKSGAESVPQSLAKLFVPPADGQHAHTVKLAAKRCICSGLTESTFMVPKYFDDDDDDDGGGCGHRANNTDCDITNITSSTSLKKDKTNCRSQSSDSLLNTKDVRPKPFSSSTLGKKESKSIEWISERDRSRKSILECNVNPYELILNDSSEHHKATSLAGSVHKAESTFNHAITSTSHSQNTERWETSRRHKSKTLSGVPKGLLNSDHNIRIAGQTVYSKMSFKSNDKEHVPKFKSDSTRTQFKHLQTTTPSFSDSNWVDESQSQLKANKTNSKSSRKDFFVQEPEPDYDMNELDHCLVTLPNKPKLEHTKSSLPSSSRTRPRINPPHLPSKLILSTSSTKFGTPPPPPPPPPPPADFFLSSSSSSTSQSNNTLISSTIVQSSTISRPAYRKPTELPKVESYQDELKEKLDRGVKSILKKTCVSTNDETASGHNEIAAVDTSTCDATPNTSSDASRCLTVESKSQDFESQTLRPKKQVHFRMRRNQNMVRCLSTSHIITETIHEEEDEHNDYYDDVSGLCGHVQSSCSIDNINYMATQQTSRQSASDSGKLRWICFELSFATTSDALRPLVHPKTSGRADCLYCTS